MEEREILEKCAKLLCDAESIVEVCEVYYILKTLVNSSNSDVSEFVKNFRNEIFGIDVDEGKLDELRDSICVFLGVDIDD